MPQKNIIVETSESHSSLTITVKKPSLRYFNDFLNSKCAPDLLALKVFPNAKEISESGAAYRAAKNLFGPTYFGDSSVGVVVVGDGSSPRTGAVFAFRSLWTVYSVDPQMGSKSVWSSIQRLTTYRMRIEDWKPSLDQTFSRVVICAVHSHADLDVAYRVCQPLAPRVSVIAIPCCTKQEINPSRSCTIFPTAVYDDWGIWSPHRTVKVWRDLPGRP